MDDLEFVLNGKTGVVHVVSGDEAVRERAWCRELAPLALEPPQPVLALMWGPVVARCGWVGRTAPGFDDGYVEVFRDDSLCRQCVRSLGSQSDRAFEHAQFDDES